MQRVVVGPRDDEGEVELLETSFPSVQQVVSGKGKGGVCTLWGTGEDGGKGKGDRRSQIKYGKGSGTKDGKMTGKRQRLE